MRTGTRRQWVVYGFWVSGAAISGALIGAAIGAAYIRPPLYGAALGVLSGAIDAATVMALIGWAEIVFPHTRPGRALDRAPFWVTVGVKWIAYSAAIVLVYGGRLGPRIVIHLLAASGLGAALRLKGGVDVPPAVFVAFVSFIIWVIVLLLQVSRLVGERTLLRIALGRYHRPRVEKRFFLFVDIVGSTPLAERLGPGAVNAFLDRVFQLASDPVDDHRGEVYQYVGDEMVITWTAAEGRTDARPIACYFAIERALRRAAGDFERAFGAVPRLRAALHAGPVITGEVGGSRRAIVFHGDVMNTTSRIENATRELQRVFLASADALERLEVKVAYALEDLGERQLRGREAPVRLYSVDRVSGSERLD